MTTTQPEMHPTRWGDPARAAPLAGRRARPGRAGLRARRAARRRVAEPCRRRTSRPSCSTGCARVVGAEHVLTDDETRRLRTRGKSTPDLLKARAGDLTDAPDAVVRPGDHDEVAAVLAYAVEHHLAVVPFGGGTSVTGGLVARREGFAGVVSLDLVRMKRLLAVDPVSMTATLEPGPARPRGRGAARRARADARPLPAVLRVRHHRRLRGHPLQRPVERRLRPVRRAGRRPDRRHPERAARPRLARRPTPPAPTCASCSSAPRAPSA